MDGVALPYLIKLLEIKNIVNYAKKSSLSSNKQILLNGQISQKGIKEFSSPVDPF